MLPVPAFIAARLCAMVPPGCGILPQSIPVVSFGDPELARVATIGINPSVREFHAGGNLRVGSRARLPSLSPGSLGISTLTGAPPHVVDAAYTGCCNYFKTKNYYRGWFDKFNEVLAQAEFLSAGVGMSS